jgi:hypothetical protein
MEILGTRPIGDGEAKRGRPLGAVGKIREVHHLVARLYARGHKPPEIAAMVNRTGATIRNWLAAPATAELVAEYASEFEAEVTTELEYRQGLARANAAMAREEIGRRLAEEPEALPLAQLVRIAADADDRTGLGKTETRVNLNADLGARLDAARERSAKIIEGRAAGDNVVKLVRRV